MASKLLRCSVVGSNNEHSSRHLLQTSEPLKTQWVSFVFEGNASSDLPKCIIRDLKRLAENRAWVKRVLLYTTSEKILAKVCY